MKKFRSPYLANPHRLADVLAAIQVMGSQKWDSRTIEESQALLGEKPQSATSWNLIFDAHPEFFGSKPRNADKRIMYFLRLRHAFERTFDPETLHELTDQEMVAWKGRGRDTKLTRKPLIPSQIEALMKTAIELQVRAAAFEDRGRWWIPLCVGILAFFGAVFGSKTKDAVLSKCNECIENQRTEARATNDPPSINSIVSETSGPASHTNLPH